MILIQNVALSFIRYRLPFFLKRSRNRSQMINATQLTFIRVGRNPLKTIS